MTRFLVTYHGSGMPDPAQMEQAKAAFGQWLQTAASAVAEPGAPLRMVGQVASGEPAPAAEIGGYSILEAETADDAVALLRSHPFLTRGGTLQINEVMAV
jgi:hypothetical protein